MKKLLICLIIMTVCTAVSCSSVPKEIQPLSGGEITQQPQRTIAATADYTNTNTLQHPNIDRTLWLVAEQFGKGNDVNGDGIINCIDAAVLFYQFYPDKDDVCIELNYNPRTGLNHLFNGVFTDGAWIAVEPQAYFANRPSYRMRDVWGDSYDKTYDRDETETWKKYAR